MRSLALYTAALALLIVSGCSQPSAGATPAAPASPTSGAGSGPVFPATITDDAGRQVAIAALPKRIVSLSASNTEMLFALGLDDRIAAVDQYSDFPPAALDKPRVGSFARPDLEKIVAAEPDLVVGTEIHEKGILPELERRGLATIILNPKDVKGVLGGIELLGRVTGRQREADALVGDLQAQVQGIESRVQGAQPVRVFFELSPQLHTAGPGSFVNDLIRLAGGTNIAAGAGKEWPQLNQEAVLLADPEVVFLADHVAGETPESVAARPGWKQISAVRDSRVLIVDPNMTNRPGPRVVEGLEFVARALHPQRMGQGSGR